MVVPMGFEGGYVFQALSSGPSVAFSYLLSCLCSNFFFISSVSRSKKLLQMKYCEKVSILFILA